MAISFNLPKEEDFQTSLHKDATSLLLVNLYPNLSDSLDFPSPNTQYPFHDFSLVTQLTSLKKNPSHSLGDYALPSFLPYLLTYVKPHDCSQMFIARLSSVGYHWLLKVQERRAWAQALSLSAFEFFKPGFGEGNGNPLHCSCLENPRDGGAQWAAVYGSRRVGHD